MEIKLVKNDKNYNLNEVKALLHQTYWAKNWPDEMIKKSIEHSLCYFMYADDKLIGFCRAITDYATNYYLCDVVVSEEYRESGYGKQLVDAITSDEEICKIKGLLLTKDKHKFYEKFGFYSRENVFMQKDKQE